MTTLRSGEESAAGSTDTCQLLLVQIDCGVERRIERSTPRPVAPSSGAE
ncbi:hypothetical protein GS506_01750 [Rhodococcus hoagii]|uniref:Uncharacterized protein n=1 Tax=Prescottella equi ATCC 33707 TaxID=525370 RepID=E9T1X4_RHOHA|nr:hypothetical protein HMPREF0724_12551 [Prescottella equi ATCC 33707]NKR44146.1 hypothetical protein [Prescottella equi]